MGVEPRTARDMVEHVELAADVRRRCGADLLARHGPRRAPNAATIERYFRTVLDASRIPCVVSSHHFIGYTLEPELMRALADDYEH
jgi:hypothetical protein